MNRHQRNINPEGKKHKIILEIDKIGQTLTLPDGRTLNHDNRRGYIIGPNQDVEEWMIYDGPLGGRSSWVEAEFRSNGVKGPGHNYGVYKKRPDLKK